MRRLPLAVALAVVLPLALVSTSGGSAAAPDQARASAVAPTSKPAKQKYRATISWTKHGIPHITAGDWGSLGFGSGYAAAESSICVLADTLITGRGLRSRYFGPKGRYNDQVSLEASNLQVDTLVGDLHNRRVVEKLLRSKAGPRGTTKKMVRGYVAGINKWLRTHKVTDPACKKARYLKPNAKPIDLWYGVYMANLLASAGVFVKEIADASPPTLTDPGLPELPISASAVTADQLQNLLTALGRDPEKPFGSNATAVGKKVTSTKRGMLLGNPHFPWRGRFRFTQQQLTIPGKYNVAGASLIGSPAVNIGWNNNVAWSHTVSTAYRFTPYEYKVLPIDPTRYLTESGIKKLQHRTVKVKVKKKNGKVGVVKEDLWRTAEGYVIDSPATFMPWNNLSVWAIRDANAEHLRTVDTFLEMGKATNVRDLLRRQDAMGGMPWVNTTAADRQGNVLYADHSVVPNLPDSVKTQCLTPIGLIVDQLAGLPGLDGTFAQGRCRWRTDKDAQRPGIFGPKNLPSVVRQDWVMNANDSYWLPNPASPLEGYASIIGCEKCERTMRTRMVSQYVIDQIKGGGKETPRSFRGHEHANRLRTAEVMRQGGALDAVCAATGETKACAVLKKWDGRSRTTSVGTHIFEEFIKRAPAGSMWLVPFNAADPLNTPRKLNAANPQVIAAMRNAIAYLRQKKIPFDKPWGKLQVAGDRGAPPIALGGGEGNLAGNANALASINPVRNRNRFKAITYGSSHIQAISFLDGGRIDARTILTYSQSENPKSPYSADQTRLFSKGQWVRFAWTPAQIKKDLIRKQVVSG